jgi:hypothetical protein
MAKPHVAPKFLPVEEKKKWQGVYDGALKQAKVNIPENESAQHTAALKEANKTLAVPAPTSAAEIDKLPAWQVLKKGTRIIDGEEHLTAITIDGRKYAFPQKKKAA